MTLVAILIVSPHSHIQDTALLWIGALWITAATRSIRPCWILVVAGSAFFLLVIGRLFGASLLTPLFVLLWLLTVRRCRQLEQREQEPTETLLAKNGER